MGRLIYRVTITGGQSEPVLRMAFRKFGDCCTHRTGRSASSTRTRLVLRAARSAAASAVPPAPPSMPSGGGSGGLGLGDELGLLALGGNNGFGGVGGIANEGTLSPQQSWGGLAQVGFGLMGGQSLGAATLGAVSSLYQDKLLNGIAGRLSGNTGSASAISDTGALDQ